MAKSYSDDYKAKFMAVFSELVRELTEDRLLKCHGVTHMIDAIQLLKEVVVYKVSKGEYNTGLMVIKSLCHLVKEVTPDREKKALILGWCVEWLQSFFLVTNDIMNQSSKSGQSCWYKKEAIGLIFTGAVYLILKKYFKTEPYYVQLLELFHEITYFTEVGQCLDMKTSPPDTTLDLDTFTVGRHKAIVKYKTVLYSFYLPVAVAMYMVGIDNEGVHSAVKGILLSMGEFSQIQDDYMNCYGDPAIASKTGTNIEKCKCDWLVVQALNRATPEQKEQLKANYGKDDADCVKRVKELYNQLHLQDVYTQYEDQSYSSLMTSLDKELVETGLPRELFLEFADRIYKRKK